MREDTEQEKQLKLQIDTLEKRLANYERNAKYQQRVIDVLVAVGAVTDSAVEKAREIVSSFD